MPEGFRIQRTPRGLSNLLGLFGADTPELMANEIRAIVDATQFYGIQQQQGQNAANAAAASGTPVVLTAPATQYWVVFNLAAVVLEQAAMTYCDLTLSMNGQTTQRAGRDAGFTAGRELWATLFLPYPFLLLPGQSLAAVAKFAGVANANVTLSANVGVLG